MHGYGTDRVRRGGGGGQMIIVCRRSKGWTPRVPKSLTRAEYPGTAVMWEEQYFEVVTAEESAEGVRYVLEPWRDNHVIRIFERYDDETEGIREQAHRAAVAREKGRRVANLGGILTGHLPAVVQERLGNELGIVSTKLTALSLVLPLIFEIWFANDFVRRSMDPNLPRAPLWLTALAGYLMIESCIRLNIAWLHRRPIGSAAGFIIYLIYYTVAGKYSGATSPFTVQRGQKLFFTEPTADIALQDAFTMREPLLTLLSPQEQKALEQRFGFNYRKHAFTVAWLLLGLSTTGVITSMVSLKQGRISAIISLLLALAVGGEQLFRLPSLRRGPVGSALAIVIRPFTRKLFQ